MLVERARRLLETGGVAFETLPHREAYTAQGVAAAVHVSGWMLAKVLVVSTQVIGTLAGRALQVDGHDSAMVAAKLASSASDSSSDQPSRLL
jgi:hypothetical protein